MDSRLLVPASTALLDGWCGPVVLHRTRLVSVDVDDDGYALVWPQGQWISCDVLFLNLSQAEARDRVARVLAARFGVPTAHGVMVRFEWESDDDDQPSANLNIIGLGAEFSSHYWTPCGVRALAGIDPDDDTRLPDGSRLVDALALAAVAREVPRG